MTRRYSNGFTANGALTVNRVTENRTVEEYDREPTLWQTNNNGRPWRLTGTAVYELPFGPGKPVPARTAACSRTSPAGGTLGGAAEYQPGALLNWSNLFFNGDLNDIKKDNPEIALRPDGTFDPTKTWFNIDAGFERDTADQPAGFQKRVFPFRVDGVRGFDLALRAREHRAHVQPGRPPDVPVPRRHPEPAQPAALPEPEPGPDEHELRADPGREQFGDAVHHLPREVQLLAAAPCAFHDAQRCDAPAPRKSTSEEALVSTQLSRLMLILVCLAWTSVAHAQIRSATLTGTVTDPQKAIVPGASVVVTNEGTNASQELVTNDAGLFTAPLLPAGTYSITVTLSGFAPFKRSGIVLNATETVRVPVGLSVGTLDQTVEVSAGSPLLQTDRTSVSGAIGAEMIEALPNITQNPLAYAFLQAGAVPRAAAADTTNLNSFGIGVAGRRQLSAVGVNGGRAFTNDIQLDGLPVMGGGYNEASVVPNTEGLQEVRVISNNFSAEYGRGQSVISMSTKSGTNTFHGSGAYMLRHEGLDANTFANNAQGIPKREFRVHDSGGSIGGPVLRNKLFFFSSYHLLRNDQETTSLLTVPTALERVGNFSQTFIRDENGNAVPARIFDPFKVTQINADLYRRAEIPNAIIPNPDPYTVRMYSYYPLPNRTPEDVFNTNNFESTTTQTIRRHSSNNRVDFKWKDHAIYGSGGISYAEVVTPRPFGTAPFNDAPATRGDKNPYIQVGDAVVLSPTLLLDVRYGLSRVKTQNLNGNKEGFTDYASFGVPDNLLPYIFQSGSAPAVTPNGYGGGNGGGSNWTGLSAGTFGTARERQANHSVSGSLTKTRGNWVHKSGLEYRNLLSHYDDPEQASVGMPSPFAHQGGNFNFEYATASGGVASLVNTNAQRGVNAAGMLLGTGVWSDPPGRQRGPGFLAEVLRDVLAERLARDVEADGQPRAAVGSATWADRAVQPHVVVGFHGSERLRHGRGDRVPWRRRLQPQPVGYDLRQLGTAGRRRVSMERPDRAARRLRYHLPADQHRLLLEPGGLRRRELRGRRAAAGVRHEPGGCTGNPLLGSGAGLAGDRRRSGQRRRSMVSGRRASTATSRTGRRGNGMSSSSARSAPAGWRQSATPRR